MKIPKDIVTRHKIRDFKICKMFVSQPELTYNDIGSTFGISGSRIERILYANRVLIKSDKEWEKEKRIRLLKRWIRTQGESKKDSADLLDQLRREFNGERNLVIDQSVKITFQDIKIETMERDELIRGINNRLSAHAGS